MAKALIITVGAQGEQINFSIDELKPDYLGLLATDTEASKNTVKKIFERYPRFSGMNSRVEYVEDKPEEISHIVKKFNEIFSWLHEEEKIELKDIIIDPTGGRKWMSSGVTMIASFLGLQMNYVDVQYKEGKPDPTTMKVVSIGNAYEQAGFLEEEKAYKLFNENNFSAASYIYDNLLQKLTDPRPIEIKKYINDGFLCWSQFQFKKALQKLKEAKDKISQYKLLKEHQEQISKYCNILEILSKNEEPNSVYFALLKEDSFFERVLLTFIAQSERYAENAHFDQSVILLYRILELISQYRLAKHDIDTNKIPQEIREKYNEEFKKITKEIFNAEMEIPDIISLMNGWILLFCLKDEVVASEKLKQFLSGLRDQIKSRDLLWIEHGNKSIRKEDYEKFKKYVYFIVKEKIKIKIEEKLPDYRFIKFRCMYL